MKTLLLATIFLGLLPAAIAQVQIHQVYYNAFDESNSEAVELINAGSTSVDISGWTIQTQSSAADATIPPNTILQPQQTFLIADAGWSESKDNVNWKAADHEEELTLANTNAGVAISNGNIIDAVGWGSATIVEGTATNGAAEGNALLRTQDTNNNIDDFIEASPDFISDQGQVTIELTITAQLPQVNVITIPDDDPTQNGVQITPLPGQNKSIIITADIDNAESATLLFNNNQYAMNSEAEINLFYDLPPGNYDVTVTAENQYGEHAQTTSFEYQPLIAFALDNTQWSATAVPGETITHQGDSDFSTAAMSVKNVGNSMIDMQLFATDLQSAQSSIAVSQVHFDVGTGMSVLSTQPQTANIDLQPGLTTPLSLQIVVPQSAAPETYTGSVFLTAVGT